MSWAVILFNAKEKIPSNLDFDDSILIPTSFCEILENSFGDVIKNEDHREIKRPDYSIDFFADQEQAGVIMLNLYGERGLFVLIELAKEKGWQIFDTSLNGFIDLSKPEQNGYKEYRAYIDKLMKGD